MAYSKINGVLCASDSFASKCPFDGYDSVECAPATCPGTQYECFGFSLSQAKSHGLHGRHQVTTPKPKATEPEQGAV